MRTLSCHVNHMLGGISVLVEMRRSSKRKVSKQTAECLKNVIMTDNYEKLKDLIVSKPSLLNCQFNTDVWHEDGILYYWTPLCWSVRRESLGCFDVLVKEGADLYQCGYREDRFLRSSFNPLSLACKSRPCKMNMVRRLLELGVDADTAIPGCDVLEEEGGILSYNGYVTGLHYAIYSEELELVQTLLKYGASVTKLDREGNTPLHLACESGSSDVIKTVLFYGGLANSLNTDSLSPLGLLWQNRPSDVTYTEQLVECMLDAGYCLNSDRWYVKNLKPSIGQQLCCCGQNNRSIGSGGRAQECLRHLLPCLCRPYSLKAVCRSVIRRRLFDKDNPPHPSVIEDLPLPPLLRSYVSLLEKQT